MVVGLIEGRAHQVVHGGIDDDEVFVAVLFDEFHTGQQCARIADQAAAGFQNQFQAAAAQEFLHGCGIGGQIGCFFVLIDDADAAAQVDVLQTDSVCGQLVDERQQAFAGFNQRFEFDELGADVAVYADDVQVRQGCGVQVGAFCIFHGDAEFVGFQAGGDIGVGLRVHIGVDAQGDGGGGLQTACYFVDAVEFGQAFDVEAFDA